MEIQFNGQPLNGDEHRIGPENMPPIAGHIHCPCGNIIYIEVGPPPTLEQWALRYLWHEVIQKGRDYVSLDRMAEDMRLRYDQCETFVAKFHAERKIPRLKIIEEVEG